jgi:hypothetical protein
MRRFVHIDYVSEGMPVIAPYDQTTGTGIRCTVIVAAGYHARVLNERYKFDRWFHIDDLRREETEHVE